MEYQITRKSGLLRINYVGKIVVLFRKDKIKYTISQLKREKSLNKSTNQILRKKLHDLEQNHAPAVNRKSVRSKINCWFNKENQKDSRNNKNKFENYFSYIKKKTVTILSTTSPIGSNNKSWGWVTI